MNDQKNMIGMTTMNRTAVLLCGKRAGIRLKLTNNETDIATPMTPIAKAPRGEIALTSPVASLKNTFLGSCKWDVNQACDIYELWKNRGT